MPSILRPGLLFELNVRPVKNWGAALIVSPRLRRWLQYWAYLLQYSWSTGALRFASGFSCGFCDPMSAFWKDASTALYATALGSGLGLATFFCHRYLVAALTSLDSEMAGAVCALTVDLARYGHRLRSAESN